MPDQQTNRTLTSKAYLRGYRDGLIAAGYCPDCEDEADFCNYDHESGMCDESIDDAAEPQEPTNG